VNQLRWSTESQVKLIERPRKYPETFNFPHVDPLNPSMLEVRDAISDIMKNYLLGYSVV